MSLETRNQLRAALIVILLPNDTVNFPRLRFLICSEWDLVSRLAAAAAGFIFAITLRLPRPHLPERRESPPVSRRDAPPNQLGKLLELNPHVCAWAWACVWRIKSTINRFDFRRGNQSDFVDVIFP